MSEKPKRRWYQFSLKTLLVTITILCIGPGGFVAFEQSKSRRQKAAVDLIEARGGGVDYDDEVVRRSPAMRSVLGEDRYSTTRSVSLRSQETRDCIPYLHVFPHLQDLYLGNISDADLVHLKALSTLKWLDLRETNITDSGLASLVHLSKLEALQLYGTRVSDDGLVHLGGLHHLTLLDMGKTQVTDAGLVAVSRLMSLERLYLFRAKITNAGLERLADLPKLTYLDLTATAVTDAGVQRLQKALPSLEIDRHRPWE